MPKEPRVPPSPIGPRCLLGLALVATCAVVVGCSSGRATLQTDVDLTAQGVAITVTTEGKNTFGAHGIECTAKGDSSCDFFLPAKLLQGGWNELTLDTKRRTDEPVVARFYVGEELFAADCSVAASKLSPDPAEMQVHVACRFPEGFWGEVEGKKLDGGSGTLPGDRCLGDVTALQVDPHRPLLRGAVPVDGDHLSGARFPVWGHADAHAGAGLSRGGWRRAASAGA